mmetsp:Transcript_37612/g.69446  ORF Transcript_37612/g.69446 Transcript_37612/m.69446 type:complete len:504 (-) Transcript_37612:7-1518(-)
MAPRVLLLAASSAVAVASSRPPSSVFCAYDCSARAAPTRPGSCFQTSEIYRTLNRSWLVYETRERVGIPEGTLPDFLPEWADLTAGNFTWEGWFRVLEVPSYNTTLMGTYGANHDGTYWALGESRRRFGAITLDTNGALSLSTNTGRSTGEVQQHPTGPNASDGKWHHVAAVFLDVGGVQVSFASKVTNVDILIMQTRPSLINDFLLTVRQVVAEQAQVPLDEVFVALSDESERRFGFWTRLWVNFTVNSPVHSVQDLVYRLTDHATIVEQMRPAVRALEEVHMALPPFTGKDEIEVTDVSGPVTEPTGTAQLYIDGYEGTGSITYDPFGDNVGQDSQLVFGGGRLGDPIDAEVSRLRLWNRAMVASELEQIWNCEMPSTSTLFGGPFPHNLQARFDLNGDLGNSAGTINAGLNDSQILGTFARGGPCSIDRCPDFSPNNAINCPLIKSHQLNFSSPEACDTFAKFNFCRKAGATRGEPHHPRYQGCDAGAPVIHKYRKYRGS